MPGKRRLCRSYVRLRKNLGLGSTLLDQFFDNPGGKPRKPGQPRAHEQELLRSVLVLCIGGLDAFLSEFVVEFLPQIARDEGATKIFDTLAKESPGLILRALFLEDAVPREAILAEVLERHFLGKAMHGPDAVSQATRWCGLQGSAGSFNSGDFPDAMATLKKRTDQRHRIVHRGEKVKLARDETGRTVDLVQHIGRVLNDKAIATYG